MKRVTVKELIEGLEFYSRQMGEDEHAVVSSNEESIYIVLPNEEIPLEVWRKNAGAEEKGVESNDKGTVR